MSHLRTRLFLAAATFVAASSAIASITNYSNDFSSAGNWSYSGGISNEVGISIGTGTGSLLGWTYTNSGADATAGTYAIQRSTSAESPAGFVGDGASGDGALRFDVQNATNTDEYISYQLGGTMSLGEQYSFTGNIFTPSGASFSVWTAQLVSSTGTVLSTTTKTNTTNSAVTPAFNVTYTAGAGDVGNGLFLRVSEAQLAGEANASRDIYIDNLAFTATAVPEPSTYGLMGAGAVAAVAFLRRRRKNAVAA